MLIHKQVELSTQGGKPLTLARNITDVRLFFIDLDNPIEVI